LVAQTLTGSREAFAKIVTRYQSLICALSYSATGDLKQSEDLAQETFLTAWKELGKLREPAKLRSWLCRISRNHTYDALKQRGHEPSHGAESLDVAAESPAPEPLPAEQAMTHEEQAILWRSIERIPEIYREALVLYYREHQSLETVAQNLDLTEDAVKQRLSRGRKLLQDQVLSFVEGALGRTNPGQAFTLSVMDALPALTVSAKAATIGVVAKGAGAKAVGMLGVAGAVASPLLMVFGNYTNYRMSMDEARTDEERGHIKAMFLNTLWIDLILTAVFALPLYLLCRTQSEISLFWGMLACTAFVFYFLILLVFGLSSIPPRRRYLARQLQAETGGRFPEAAFEYRSRATLFGWPLLHIRIGDRFDLLRGPVKAWFAIGSSHAVGLIFASGGLAIAPISYGGIAIGLISFGAIGLGVISLAACAFGVFSYGALAVGWQAVGGMAVAWNAANGALATALGYAIGNIAHAAQANNAAATQFVNQSQFLRWATSFAHHGIWTLLIWIIPTAVQGQIVARARRRDAARNS
jgi:RNA polymerase sigma factor (sigma-70 family)